MKKETKYGMNKLKNTYKVIKKYTFIPRSDVAFSKKALKRTQKTNIKLDKTEHYKTH